MVCPSFLQTEMDKEQQMDMVGTYQSTNKAWDSLLSTVRSLLKWLHIGIAWPKDTNSEALARGTVTALDSKCSADGVSLRFLIMLFKLKSRREALKNKCDCTRKLEASSQKINTFSLN